MGLIGIAQMGQSNRFLYGVREVPAGFFSAFGTYYNRDHAAGLMAMSALVGGGLLASRFTRHGSRESFSNLSDLIATQALIAFCLGVLVYGLFVTGSRGGAHTLVLAAWLAGFWASGWVSGRRNIWLLRFALLAMAAAFAWYLTGHPERLGFPEHAMDTSTAFRLSMYRSGLKAFLDFPVFGTGLGSLGIAFPAYQEGMIRLRVEQLHSDWFEMAVLAGLAGLFGWGCAIATVLGRSFRESLSDSRERRWVYLGVFAAALAFIGHGLIDFNFQIPANAVIFLTLLSAMSQRQQPSQAHPSRWPGRVMTILAAAAFCASLGPAIASYFELRAKHAEPAVREALLARAYEWDHRPRFRYLSALTRLELAEKSPASRVHHLRVALELNQDAMNSDPFNRHFRQLSGVLLSRLGRNADAQGLLEAGS